MFLVLISLIRYATKLCCDSDVTEEYDWNKETYMIVSNFQSINLGSLQFGKL